MKMEQIQIIKKEDQFIKIPLTNEDLLMSVSDLARKYGIDYVTAKKSKERGYINKTNTNFISIKEKEKKEEEDYEKFIKEITEVPIQSIETVIGNEKEHIEVKKILEIYNKYKYRTKDKNNPLNLKKFKLKNGQTMTYGDFIVIDKIISFKMFRDDNGRLMMFDKKENKFIPFSRSNVLLSHASFAFSGSAIDHENNMHVIHENDDSKLISLESFAPNIFKSGFFKKSDFERRSVGTPAYEIYGPHERKISKETPYAFFSNGDSSARYYIGKEKFVGTDIKINHDTVRLSLLDNKTVAITDIVNEKKVILFTFPLLSKEEYEEKKGELVQKVSLEKVNDYIIVGGEEMNGLLKKYSTLDYLQKRVNETNDEFVERVSRLSDISYVLGNFRSFISKTHTSAINFSWQEQLVLADSLARVGQEKKLVEFGKKFNKDGIRTFVSVEQGGKEMGDKILTLGEKLPEDIAQEIFAKYGEYIDAVDSVAQFIEKEYKLPISPEIIEKLKEALLLKGKNLLVEQAEKVSGGNFSEEKILNSLENSKADVFLFKNMFKIAKESNPEISFEDFSGLHAEKITPGKLVSVEDLESIKIIIQENYTYDPKLGEYAFDSLKNAINSNNKITDLNLLRRDEKIIALDRTDHEEDDSVYFGSFNVDPKYCSSKIGDAFFQATIYPLMKEKIIKADCPIRNPISAYYIESGFVGNELHIVGNTELMAIISSPEQNFESKKLPKEEIKKLLNDENSKIKVFSAKNQEELPVREVNTGKILTRYFFDKISGDWYIAFE